MMSSRKISEKLNVPLYGKNGTVQKSAVNTTYCTLTFMFTIQTCINVYKTGISDYTLTRNYSIL